MGFYYISLDSCKVWKHLQTLYQCCAWALKIYKSTVPGKTINNLLTLKTIKGAVSSWYRAWNQSASFRLTQWVKIIPHMIRSYHCCCCMNEPVNFSHCVHLKLGYWFHALLKVWSDHDDTVPFNMKSCKSDKKVTGLFSVKIWKKFLAGQPNKHLIHWHFEN